GSFEAAKRCISDLCSIGYDVRIGTTIWSKNVEELEEIANLAESLGAKEVAYNWLQPSGNALKNPEILLDNKSFPEISRRLNSLDVSIKTSFHRAGYSDEESICQAGRDIFYIAGDRIWPCSWVRVADANFGSQLSLREHTLQYILENDRNLKAFRNIAEKAKGSCPSMAKIYTDNLLGLDPIQEGGIHR
ncbi:MAG: hypothetical protein ACMXYK_05345, partial [Candidatus Woesearchaeota archaeon]